MITAILLALAVIIVIAFFVFVSSQPDDFVITRSEAISAPPAVPFAHVNDFHQWIAWSPWEGLDPDLKRTYEGPAEGVGTSYAWDSAKSKVGAGRMTIAASEPPRLIRIDLEFIRPFPNKTVAEFTFNPRGDHTIVTWSMSGKDKFVAKLFCVICNREKLVGGMFSQGLTKLKAVCEKTPVAK